MTLDEDLSAMEIATQGICSLINSDHFVAGQRLPERDLVEALGVSKTVLREAFSRLHADGIIDLQRYRGATVRRLSSQDVNQVLRIGSVVLGLASFDAAQNISRPGKRQLFKAAVNEFQACQPFSQAAHIEMYFGMQDAIITLADNTQLAWTLNRLHSPLVLQFMRREIPFNPAFVERTRERLSAVASAILGKKPVEADLAARELALSPEEFDRFLRGAAAHVLGPHGGVRQRRSASRGR